MPDSKLSVPFAKARFARSGATCLLVLFLQIGAGCEHLFPHVDRYCTSTSEEKVCVPAQPQDPGRISGIWGNPKAGYFAVGDHPIRNGVILYWDGHVWQDQTTPTTDITWSAVWGSSGQDVWVVGAHGAIVHFDGSSWQTQSSGVTEDLFGIFGTDRDDILAVGNGGAATHWNGKAWMKESQSGPPLRAVWGTVEGGYWAVGDKAAWHRLPETGWESVNTLKMYDLLGIYGLDADTIWAVGKQGTLLRKKGVEWQLSELVEPEFGRRPDLHSIWAGTGGQPWLAGDFPFFPDMGNDSCRAVYRLVDGLSPSLKRHAGAFDGSSNSDCKGKIYYSVWGIDPMLGNQVWVGGSGGLQRRQGSAE